MSTLPRGPVILMAEDDADDRLLAPCTPRIARGGDGDRLVALLHDHHEHQQ